MGITAENLVEKYKITREVQDAFAFRSQQRMAAAKEEGRFVDQIVPVTIPVKKGEPIVFKQMSTHVHKRLSKQYQVFVILNEGYEGKVSKEEIIEWSKELMADYKYPRIIEFRKQFPMTSSGKNLWRKLQEEENEKAENKVR
jgi:acyl-CoA synthetase (AMP-forming)/AMP-acid ligase II